MISVVVVPDAFFCILFFKVCLDNILHFSEVDVSVDHS